MAADGLDLFCGSKFWDLNVTWNTEDPDLTPCFEKTVLVWIPCLFLWIFSPFEVYYILHSKYKDIPWSWLNILKVIFNMVILFHCVGDFVFAMVRNMSNQSVYSVDIYSPAIKFVTFSLVLILTLFNKKRGIQASGLQFLFWLLLVISGVPQFRTFIRQAIDEAIVEPMFEWVSYMVYFCTACIIFLLNFFADVTPRFSEYPTVERPCPESSASFPSKVSFSWFNSLALLGFRQPLEAHNLWHLNYSDTSTEVVPLFEKYWSESVRKAANAPSQKAAFLKRSGSVDIIRNSTGTGNVPRRRQASILPALCKAFGPTFLLGSFLKFIQDLLSFVSPQILSLLIAFIKGKESMWRGYMYAVILLLAAMCQTIFLAQYFLRMSVVGLRIRTALISTIYRKALRMSNSARKESTVGEIVNLMAVDAQRFMDLTNYLNMIWSAPLQITLALFFLWQTLGPSVLAGLAIMIILIPVNALVANRVKVLQIRQMKNKDERVKLMNEILSGIKVLKLYAWEPSFEQQVLRIREKEMKVLKQAAYLNAATSFIWACAPFMVTLFTFGVYILVDDKNVLTVEKAFVSLALFNIIRIPMALFPIIIAAIIEVSLATFAVYVLIDEKNELDAQKAFVALALFNQMRVPLVLFPVFMTEIIKVSLVTFAVYVLVDENNVLDAQKAFVSLSLFNILRFPLSMLPMLISNMVQTGVSVKRINKFMNADELDPNSVTHDLSEKDPLVMENGTFSWGDSQEDAVILRNINIRVKQGGLVAVVGTVGSGKSSLVSAFLGEMDKITGRVNTKGSVAYVPQQAWIQNATMKDNILFGRHLDQNQYHKIVSACALQQDLDMLPAGDKTEIGEKGINLSGGQKQRVSLARAVYSDSDVYFLDDPLSAVDSHVGKHIFENVIGPKGILKKKTRVLVTHGVTYLPEVDLILVMKDGSISESGTYKELLAKKGAFADFLVQHLQEVDEEDEPELDDIKQQLIGSDTELRKKFERQKSTESGSVRQRSSHSESGSVNSLTRRRSSTHSEDKLSLNNKKAGDKLIEVEKAETGGVKKQVYAYYLKSIGAFLTIATIVLNVIYQVFAIGSNIWLSEWSSDTSIIVNGTQDTAKRDMYLGVYAGFGIGQAITILISTLCLYLGLLSAARLLHSAVLINTLRVPMEFFDVTPVGRILNRFSKDIESLDQTLPDVIRGWLSCFSSDANKLNIAYHNIETTVDLNNYMREVCAFVMESQNQGVLIFFADLLPRLGCWLASLKLHHLLLSGVLHAPLSFTDTTPSGRILARFSKDIEVVDSSLPQEISDLIYVFYDVVATMVVISFTTPIFVAVIIPIGIVYYFVQRFYVATSRQLKRLESVSRSPIYSHFGESVQGAPSIRAYCVQSKFISESEQKVDFNQVCLYPSLIANRWLAVRLETVGNLIIFFSALFAVLSRDTTNAGLVGLSVSYALQITQTLNWLVRMTSDVETNIVAVERIKEYGETPREAPWEKSPGPPDDWPSRGKVDFKDYQVRYREGLDLVLKGISFSVKGGEKVGIVGRTGAGKSSLTLSLFRILEAANGQILIDDIDIATLGLHALRSRLTIIPQDPVLFSGTLRMNMDPFNKEKDDSVWRALELAHLKNFVKSLSAGLQHQVTEGGENLSVGQRQLICLGRALLRKTKVLILDEATAAVDLETDDLIQRTIRTEFKDCTVLTIAHRLNTIMDSDRVIVLDKGVIVEYDSPSNLLKNRKSIFYGMAKDANLV